MISTVTVEAHYSTNYIENYLDSVENLPEDVQRYLSRIREIDVLYRGHLQDVEVYCEQYNTNQPQNGTGSAAVTTLDAPPTDGAKGGTSEGSTSSSEQSSVLKRVTNRIQKGLIAAQELGDEKLQIIQQLLDLIDHKTRQLDQDFSNLGNEFFARLDYVRDDKTIDGGRDGNGSSFIGTMSGSANNGHGQYGVAGNGPGIGSNMSGGPGGGNGSSGGIGSSAHILHASNGTGGIGSGVLGGGGNGSGMYGGNNGGNGGSSLANERSSKRARRTRNEQTGGSANGSNTPNSLCGVSPMDIDPIEGSMGGSGSGMGGGAGPGGGSGIGGVGNIGSSGNATLAGGNGGSSGGLKQDTGSGGMPGSGGIGSGAVGGSGGSGSSHNSLSGSGSSQAQGSMMGGNGSRNGNGASGVGSAGAGNVGAGSGSSGGNGGGGSGASGSNSQLNSSNQGSSKKGTGSNNAGSGGGTGGANSGKKKKRKTGGRGSQATREAREDTPAAEETIDPDEPTYCLCDQISFGEMILCDNDLCPIEWFHFSCVSLISKPKGRWYCPNCRGDRPNVMKPKAQFLKELERYNKEKEEKT
ncbi:uncharacterized PE-PGRS family protein PE_PGRS20 [Anopheles nili]|uniref:uncharacterized PE-PGRS family protein PE_PGRS20 n=1 Tax=Anopheles nili TaxID=185578 RepID=UPI00237AF29C|nr:uncharacterized PE-PGRS family protein PE_PGRS20 [Anopheles nili]